MAISKINPTNEVLIVRITLLTKGGGYGVRQCFAASAVLNDNSVDNPGRNGMGVKSLSPYSLLL